jgi:hypothetical protein
MLIFPLFFSTQKSNDPADLDPTPPGGGLRSDPVMGAHKAKGPFIPSQEMANNLEQPLVSMIHTERMAGIYD